MALDVHIRPYDNQRDRARFVELNFSTFYESMPAAGRMAPERFRKIHARLLRMYPPEDAVRSRVTIAATANADYIGHCWLGVQVDFFTQDPVPWVFDLSVLPVWRGQGVGKFLLDDCRHHCRTLGYAALGLQVMGHNEAARRFYEREGFAIKANAMQLGLR